MKKILSKKIFGAVALVALCLSLMAPLGMAQAAKTDAPVYKGSAEETAIAAAYRFTPDPKLPNVLLLGDSISIGYTLPAREQLKGVANVYRPMQADGRPENCSGSEWWVKGNLERWLKAQPKWDVIHFNTGLHDLKRIDWSRNEPDRGKVATPNAPNNVPLETYKGNLEQIVVTLKATGARLIFATITPTVSNGVPVMVPEDVTAYNAAAVAIMRKHGIAIDDLYAKILPRQSELQIPANVHFKKEGSKFLGEWVARAVAEAIKAPAPSAGEPLGRWAIYPEKLISGAQTRIELRYTNGNTTLPPGSYFEFDLEPLSVKTMQHTPPSTDFKIVALKGGLPKVEIQNGRLTGVGYSEKMKLLLPEGLKPGQSFAMLIGNRSGNGDVVGLVSPIPVHGLSFNIRAVLGNDGKQVDWFKSGWGNHLPRVDIEAGPASALRVFAPTLMKAGDKFPVRVAVTDAFDSGCYPAFTGKVLFSPMHGVEGLPLEMSFKESDRSGQVVEGVRIAKPGVYRLVAQLNKKSFESNPIVVRGEVEKPIFWGLLHSHNWYSEGWGDGPRETYRFARDVSGLDFVGLSDHIGAVPDEKTSLGRLLPYRVGRRMTSREEWMDCMVSANAYNRDGRFTALLGYEFADESCSHYVAYWPDLTEENYAMMWPKGGPEFQTQLIDCLGAIDAMVIPHVHATYVPYNEWNTGLTKSGYLLTPVVEANSDWGMAFPGYGISDPLLGGGKTDIAVAYPKVIARGFKAGIVGDSDCHEGLPGRRVQAAMSAGHASSPQGITAVSAKGLTRREIIAGYRSRGTYSTSGERIFLEASAGGVGMGGEVEIDGPVSLNVQVNGTDVVEEVNLWNGSGIVQTKKFGNARDLKFAFETPAPVAASTPYFVEVIQRNHHRAWSSPLWIGKKSSPDLAWETDAAGKLFLVNRGQAEAKNIHVMGSDSQSPFATANLGAVSVDSPEPCAQIQVKRWTDQQVTLGYYYKGPQTTQKIVISGFTNYQIEPNRGQWWSGVQHDDKSGTIEFTNGGGRVASSAAATKSEWRGLDITITIDPTKPCSAKIYHDAEFKTYIGKKVISGKQAELKVNTLAETSASEIFIIPSLGAGQRTEMDRKYRVYSADPLNEIQETQEDNNLFEGN